MAFVALFGAGIFTAAEAAVIYTTGFEQPEYSQSGLNSQEAWTASGSYSVQGGGLDYSGGVIDNDGGAQSAVVVAPNNSDNAIHAFTAQTDDVYFSFMLNWSWSGTPASGETAWFYLGQLNGTTSSLGVTALSAPEIIRGRIVQSNNSFNNSSSSESISNATTLMVVGKLSKSGLNGSNYDTLEFITNPTDSVQPIAWPNSVSADSGVSSVDRLVFRVLQGGAGSLADDAIAFDNIVIGTEYEDVVSAIPEASSFAMLLGAALFLLCLLRDNFTQERS